MARPLTANQRKCFVDWLRIPESECPPSWYQLLDIAPFEEDRSTIEGALFRRLNEISLVAKDADQAMANEAKVLIRNTAAALLEPDTKATYDEKLRAGLKQRAEPMSKPSAVESVVQPAAPAGNEDATESSAPPTPTTSNIPAWAIGLLITNLVVIAAVGGLLLFKGAGGHKSAADDPDPSRAQGFPAESENKTEESTSISLAMTGEEESSNSTGGLETVESNPGSPEEAVANADSPEVSAEKSNQADETDSESSVVRSQEKPGAVLGDASEAVRESNDKDPEDPNPLSKLVKAATLPPIGEFGNNSDRSVSLGVIGVGAKEQLTIGLDDGSIDLSQESRLAVQPSKTLPGNWELVVQDYATGAVRGEPLARMFVDDDNRLRLAWFVIGNRRTAAMQVANAALLLSVGDYSHRLPLREPVGAEYASPFLSDELIDIPFEPIEAMPWAGRLRLGIKGVPDYEYPLTVSEYVPVSKTDRDGSEILGMLDLMLGENQQVRVAASLIKKVDGGFGMRLEPTYKQARSKKGRTKPLTIKSLGAEVRRQQRFVSKNYATYVDAVRRAPIVARALLRASNQAKQLFAAGNSDAAGAQTEANRLSSEHQSLMRTIKTIGGKLPESYEILAYYYSVVRLSRALHDSAGIEYRLYIEGRQGDIDLLVGNGKLKDRQPRFPTGIKAGVTGDWIRLSPSVVYRFTPGVLTLINPAGGSTRGNWRLQEQRVDLTYRGASEAYELVEDVILRGATTNLYRAF